MMQSKQTFGLIAVTIVVAAIAVMMYQGGESGGSDRFVAIKPYEALAVGSIARIKLDDGSAELELEKQDADTWGLKQRGGFPIDGERLRRMVISISGLKLVDELTADPTKFDRLGVGEEPSGGSVVVEGENGALAKILIGDARTAGGDAGMGFERPVGQYVRIDNRKPVYLTAEPFTIESSAANWLQRDILKVDKSTLQMVSVDAGSTETYTLKPNAAGTFELDTAVPSGKKVLTARVNQVGNALSNLRLDDVLPKDEATSLGLTFGTTYEAVALNGLIYRMESATKDSKYYIRLSAKSDPTFDITPHEDEATTETESVPPQPSPSEMAAQTAEEINAKHGDWIYQIGKYAYDGLSYKFSALLEDDTEATATPTPKPAITPNPGALQPSIMDLPSDG